MSSQRVKSQLSRSLLNSTEQLLHSDSCQVGVEVALVVSTSEHQQISADGPSVGIHIFALVCETVATCCRHGDD